MFWFFLILFFLNWDDTPPSSDFIYLFFKYLFIFLYFRKKNVTPSIVIVEKMPNI